MSLFITGAPKSIRIDLSMTRAAVAVGALTVVMSSIAEVVARANLLAYEIVWWFKVLDVVFGTITVMALLILYQVAYTVVVIKCVIYHTPRFFEIHSRILTCMYIRFNPT